MVVGLEVDVIVTSGKDAFEAGTVGEDIAVISAAALDGRVTVGHGLARGIAEALGNRAHIVGRSMTAVKPQGLIGHGFCTIMVVDRLFVKSP